MTYDLFKFIALLVTAFIIGFHVGVDVTEVDNRREYNKLHPTVEFVWEGKYNTIPGEGSLIKITKIDENKVYLTR